VLGKQHKLVADAWPTNDRCMARGIVIDLKEERNGKHIGDREVSSGEHRLLAKWGHVFITESPDA
jgi:hypothetical protein